MEGKMGTLVWDTCQLTDDEIQYQKEEKYREVGRPLTPIEEKEIQGLVFKDSYFLETAWEDLTSLLTDYMQELDPNGLWLVKGTGMGWQKKSGYKYVTAGEGEQLLHEVLPKTDCSFRIELSDKEITITNAHHDAPCWTEHYTITPVKSEDYGKELHEV